MKDSVISFRFDGGEADEHELDAYDAARFQYGAARLIYTVEAFRQTGKVPDRINRDFIKADFRIKAAEPQCFFQEIFAAAVPSISDTFLKVSVKQAIGFVFSLLFPKKENDNKIMEIALSLSKEETKRKEIETADRKELYALVRDLIQSQETPPEKAAELIRLEKKNAFIENSLDAVGSDYEKLIRINTETRNDLIAKARTQVAEIGYPLKRSANYLTISESDSTKPFRIMDISDLAYLEGTTKDETSTTLIGTIKSYDKETGWGKWRTAGERTAKPFLVRSQERTTLTEDIIEAMKEKEIGVDFYIVRTPAGTVKYLIYDQLT